MELTIEHNRTSRGYHGNGALLIIEGIQTSGKTFLVESSDWNHLRYQFHLAHHQTQSNINKKQLWGFTTGKDLGLLDFFNYQLHTTQIIIRSFVSTCVFGTIFKRASKKEIWTFFYYCLNFLLINDWKIIYVSPNLLCWKKNPRQREDGYDKINYNKQLKVYNYFLDKIPPRYLIRFENDFNENSVENFNQLLRCHFNEHK